MNSTGLDNQKQNAADPRVIFYTRQGCPLCVVGQDLVEQVCRDLGQTVKIVDIDSSAQLVAQWSDYVPVVEVDGIQQGFWRIDEDRLRRAILEQQSAGK